VNLRAIILFFAGILPLSAAQFTKEQRTWWAFQPVQKPTIPKAGNGWAQNEIDRFVARQHASQKLRPAEAAGKRELIRRVTFDLTGLPPTLEEIADYLKDDSAGAYEKVVDRLLASPRYGERQATFWLDLVRYADSDGFRADAFRPEAWRYRDYVIAAFNADKPYAQFIREQLAGDEIAPGKREAHTATMFLRHWIYEHNQRDVEMQWSDILNDVTDVTADVFLGMGMQCARCHDHKFDPILQRDYFRLRAFFAPLLPRQTMGIGTIPERAAHAKALSNWEAKTEDLRRRLHEIEHPVLLKHATREGFEKFVDEIKVMVRKRPSERTAYERQIAEMAQRQFDLEQSKLPERLKGETKAEWEILRSELKKHAALKPKPLAVAKFIVSDAGSTAPPTRIPKTTADIAPGFPSVLDPTPARIVPPAAALQSTGRRTALANWIASPNNPLTARVLVNRLWQQHFGRGLAANTSDFGSLGDKPTHPELLDWLAATFVENDWSLKKLHRLMVTSATYRMRSVEIGMRNDKTTPNSAFRNPHLADPENHFLWHHPSRRLDAEQVRDALLAASGELDWKSGGAGEDGSKSVRRSVFLKVMRNKPDAVLAAFDAPDRISHMPQRSVTTTATQSLLLLNSDWARQRAAAFALRLHQLHPDDTSAQVRAAHQLAFGREPSTDHLASGIEFLKTGGEVAVIPEPPKVGMFGKRTPSPAAWIQPGAGQRGLEAGKKGPRPTGDFTAEAFIRLDSLYEDAAVRTIISQWDSQRRTPGWALGVTSTKSAHQPRNLILQLTGIPQRGDHGYEVIASELRPELKKFYYAAVSVKFDEDGTGTATFYLKDFTTPNGKLQVAKKQIKRNKHYANQLPLVVGGRAGGAAHGWDGLIDNVRLSRTALGEGSLTIRGETVRPDTLAFWKFDKGDFLADSSPHGNTLSPLGKPRTPPGVARLAEYCHVLFNANLFLYLD
tara:strand:- start:914 stop:3781 length:2868 start_codon:yes stop_codon:yes gene_type:complete